MCCAEQFLTFLDKTIAKNGISVLRKILILPSGAYHYETIILFVVVNVDMLLFYHSMLSRIKCFLCDGNGNGKHKILFICISMSVFLCVRFYGKNVSINPLNSMFTKHRRNVLRKPSSSWSEPYEAIKLHGFKSDV